MAGGLGRALTRVATPENEVELLEVARAVTAAELERFVRGWRMQDADESEREELRHQARRFSVVPNLDGPYEVRGRPEPEVAAVLMRAIEAAGDALFASGAGGRIPKRRPRSSAEPTHDPDGAILDAGRKARTVPPALRRALNARDRGCRFPACGLRFTDAHHVEHWASGGETRLDNLILLCRHHHRLIHEGGFWMEWRGDGRAVFFDPRGLEVPELPPLMILKRAVEMLTERNRRRGVDPDWDTASADCR